jgi:hypothetical protein
VFYVLLVPALSLLLIRRRLPSPPPIRAGEPV